MNEPFGVVKGYRMREGGAPALDLDSPADYIVIHNLLKAHGTIYRLYDKKYRSTQNGKTYQFYNELLQQRMINNFDF